MPTSLHSRSSLPGSPPRRKAAACGKFVSWKCSESSRVAALAERVRFDNPPTHAWRLLRTLACGLGAGLVLGLSERRNRAKPSSRQPSPPRDRDARGTRLPGQLHPHALHQPGRAEGRAAGVRRARNLRQPEPADRQGRHPAADPRLRDRKPDGARQRRAVHALRPAGRERRDRRCAQLRDVPHQPEGDDFPTASR